MMGVGLRGLRCRGRRRLCRSEHFHDTALIWVNILGSCINIWLLCIYSRWLAVRLAYAISWVDMLSLPWESI